MSDREKWQKLRADYLAASEVLQDFDIKLSTKYGRIYDRTWISKTEQKKLEQLRQRRDRVANKMFDLAERRSPRDWGHGVPFHWIASSLSWDDVIRPLNEPLSVTPPLAYGATTPMRDNHQPWAKVFG